MATAADKASLEKAAGFVTKVLADDVKVSSRDLHDRLLKQARMPSVNALYEEASRDALARELDQAKSAGRLLRRRVSGTAGGLGAMLTLFAGSVLVFVSLKRWQLFLVG